MRLPEVIRGAASYDSFRVREDAEDAEDSTSKTEELTSCLVLRPDDPVLFVFFLHEFMLYLLLFLISHLFQLFSVV